MRMTVAPSAMMYSPGYDHDERGAHTDDGVRADARLLEAQFALIADRKAEQCSNQDAAQVHCLLQKIQSEHLLAGAFSTLR